MHDRSPILVVDDDDAIRTLVSRILQREQYDVTQAANGDEALRKMRVREFGTVVLDLMMPVVSGFEVVQYLGSNDDAGAPCVIIMSAASERDISVVSSPLVHAVLRKPFDIVDLVSAVRKCREHQDGTLPA